MKYRVKSQVSPPTEQFLVVKAEVPVASPLPLRDNNWRPFEPPHHHAGKAVRLKAIVSKADKKAKKKEMRRVRVSWLVVQKLAPVYALVYFDNFVVRPKDRLVGKQMKA